MLPLALAAATTTYELARTGKVSAVGSLTGAIGVEAKKMLTPKPAPMAKIAPVQIAALESTRAAQEDLFRKRRKSLATRLKLGEPSLQVQKLGTSGTLGT